MWWVMKINTSMVFIGFCCLILPIASFASTIESRIIKVKAHRKAVAACEGKKAGESVEFINNWNKKIKGICVDQKGILVAIPEEKLTN